MVTSFVAAMRFFSTLSDVPEMLWRPDFVFAAGFDSGVRGLASITGSGWSVVVMDVWAWITTSVAASMIWVPSTTTGFGTSASASLAASTVEEVCPRFSRIFLDASFTNRPCLQRFSLKLRQRIAFFILNLTDEEARSSSRSLSCFSCCSSTWWDIQANHLCQN